MPPGAGARAVPLRAPGLGSPSLEYVARDGAPEQSATEGVVPATHARVEPRAVRVARSGDVDQPARPDAGAPMHALRPRVHQAPLPTQGHHDLLHVREEVPRLAESRVPERESDLRLVPEEQARMPEKREERGPGVRVREFLRGVQRDRLSESRGKPGDLEVVVRASRPEVYDLRAPHRVLRRTASVRLPHGTLVDHGRLTAVGGGEDPGGRGRRTAHQPEVREVHAVLLESRPVVRGEVGADERRDRRPHPEARGHPGDVSRGAAEVAIPVQDAHGRFRRREFRDRQDVIEHDVTVHPKEVSHRHASTPRCTSRKSRKVTCSRPCSRHRRASSSFANTRSASSAGHRSEMPFPTYATRDPSARSWRTRPILQVPHSVQVGSPYGNASRTRPSSKDARFVRKGTPRPHSRSRCSRYASNPSLTISTPMSFSRQSPVNSCRRSSATSRLVIVPSKSVTTTLIAPIPRRSTPPREAQVPSVHDARYLRCFGVSASIETSIDFSLSCATFSSISRGTAWTFGAIPLPLFASRAAQSAWIEKLMSMISTGCPCPAAKFTRRPSVRT